MIRRRAAVFPQSVHLNGGGLVNVCKHRRDHSDEFAIPCKQRTTLHTAITSCASISSKTRKIFVAFHIGNHDSFALPQCSGASRPVVSADLLKCLQKCCTQAELCHDHQIASDR